MLRTLLAIFLNHTNQHRLGQRKVRQYQMVHETQSVQTRLEHTEHFGGDAVPTKLHTDIGAPKPQLKYTFICLHVPSKQTLPHVSALLKLPPTLPQKDCTIPARFPSRRIISQDNSTKQLCWNDPNSKRLQSR